MSEDKKKECNEFIVPTSIPNVGILHSKDHTLTPVHCAFVEDGKPLPSDGKLYSRREDSNIYDFSLDLGETTKTSSGPAKVNSKAYRDGYDRIFNKKELNL